jgi:hypothetical protein
MKTATPLGIGSMPSQSGYAARGHGADEALSATNSAIWGRVPAHRRPAAAAGLTARTRLWDNLGRRGAQRLKQLPAGARLS